MQIVNKDSFKMFSSLNEMQLETALSWEWLPSRKYIIANAAGKAVGKGEPYPLLLGM